LNRLRQPVRSPWHAIGAACGAVIIGRSEQLRKPVGYTRLLQMPSAYLILWPSDFDH